MKYFAVIIFFLFPAFPASAKVQSRILSAQQRIGQPLRASVEAKGLTWGATLFIRIFKQSSELEVWLQKADGTFYLFKTHPICIWSGALGPKQRTGDE